MLNSILPCMIISLFNVLLLRRSNICYFDAMTCKYVTYHNKLKYIKVILTTYFVCYSNFQTERVDLGLKNQSDTTMISVYENVAYTFAVGRKMSRHIICNCAKLLIESRHSSKKCLLTPQ